VVPVIAALPLLVLLLVGVVAAGYVCTPAAPRQQCLQEAGPADPQEPEWHLHKQEGNMQP
jgi:hypothetical protein